MSIFPATDLVAEVARAADPRRLNAAVTRLADLSSRKVKPEEFANLVEGASGAVKSAPPASSAGATVDVSYGPAAGGGVRSSSGSIESARASDVTEKFEAYIIQTCLQTILPQSEQGLFGRGTAGGVWRSMVAEQLGNQIAKAGGVGLHKMLDQHLARHAARAEASRGPSDSAT
ncbi:MAG: flagellar biosynthesis protein FlgJ [Methylocystaceae bacterium]|nr:MAG: flagellar biosynthesis protein FlgJ [Methylocystaceae bacterium]